MHERDCKFCAGGRSPKGAICEYCKGTRKISLELATGQYSDSLPDFLSTDYLTGPLAETPIVIARSQKAVYSYDSNFSQGDGF